LGENSLMMKIGYED